jgi:DNA-binding MarR family transcriptional regulator
MRIEDEIQQKSFKDKYSRAIVNLLYTHSYIVTKQNRIFKPYELSPEQYNVLRILRGRHPDPITVSSIQERMLNKMSNASRLVEKLKQKGLVNRRECSKDRRQVDVTITKSGLEILDELEAVINNFNKEVVHLDQTEVEQLNDLLDKLRG